MKYRTRTIYTPEQKAQMWDRREKGDSLHEIAGLFDCMNLGTFWTLRVFYFTSHGGPENEDSMNLGLPPLELKICTGSVISTKTTTYPGWSRSIANKVMIIKYC